MRVDEQALQGRSVQSPYFFLGYVTCVRNNATDWWSGTRISHKEIGERWLENHHIHPQTTLKSAYTKSQINDLPTSRSFRRARTARSEAVRRRSTFQNWILMS